MFSLLFGIAFQIIASSPNGPEIPKDFHSRDEIKIFINTLIASDQLGDIRYSRYEKFRSFCLRNGVYIPRYIQLDGQKKIQDRYSRTQHVLLGFHIPMNETEELNILESPVFKANIRRIRHQFHPDKFINSGNLRVQKFWWEVIDNVHRNMLKRRKYLRYKKHLKNLKEDPILIPRGFYQMIWPESLNLGLMLEYNPVGAGVYAGSHPINIKKPSQE